MAKTRVTIDLDLPDADRCSNEELRQIVFDSLINLAQISHIKWSVQHQFKLSHQNEENRQRAVQHHDLWDKALDKATFTVETL